MLRDLDGGDGELTAVLTREYERDSDHQLATIRQAVADGDAGALGRAAHTLKGASANLGAGRLAGLCADLEARGRAGGLDDAASLIAATTTELDHVQRALHDAFGEVAPSSDHDSV